MAISVPPLDPALPTSSYPNGQVGASVALYTSLAIMATTIGPSAHALGTLATTKPLADAVEKCIKEMAFNTSAMRRQRVDERLEDRTEHRHAGSRVLHVLDRWAANPTVALSVVTADLLWVLGSAAFGFPARLESVFQTLVAATTLAMVFMIQHTQAREQAATQRKLDEILRSTPQADKSMITLEEAPDDELKAAADAHRGVRRRAQS